MSNIYDNQVAKMKRLIDYGATPVNESKAVKPIVECQAEAADGNTYGILREGTRYYIKSCPTKNSAILAEDYEYIGGEMNKKANEFVSYASASKCLGMKVKAINEAYNRKPTPHQSHSVPQWVVPETQAIREEINRCNEICNNVGYIMREGNEFTMKHTLPEAPATNPSKDTVNNPFVEDGVAEGDKDSVKTSKDHKDKGPFNKTAKADPTSDKKPKGNESDAYSEDAKYSPENNIANQKPKGGKAVKVNESKRRVKITEEQALAWSKSQDFIDTSHGTEVGDGAPFDEELQEGCCECGDPNCNGEDCKCQGGNCNVQEANIPASSAVGQPDDDDDEYDLEPEHDDFDDFDFDDDFDDDVLNQGLVGGFDPTYDTFLDDYFESAEHKSKKPNHRKVNEDYQYFGKHPAYRKPPMTGTARKTAKMFGKEWDDESVASERGYGNGTGSSFPFSEKAVEAITDAVMDRVTQKLKKKV